MVASANNSSLACTLLWPPNELIYTCHTLPSCSLHGSLISSAPADAKSNGMLQGNGPLVSLLQRLHATLESDKMIVVICPRAALVSEKYVRTRMRMWGAIAKYKVQHQFSCTLP